MTKLLDQLNSEDPRLKVARMKMTSLQLMQWWSGLAFVCSLAFYVVQHQFTMLLFAVCYVLLLKAAAILDWKTSHQAEKEGVRTGEGSGYVFELSKNMLQILLPGDGMKGHTCEHEDCCAEFGFIDGASPTFWQSLFKSMTHTPCYLLRAVAILARLPRFVYALVYKRDSVVVQDEDVFNMLTNTTLLVACKTDPITKHLTFNLPFCIGYNDELGVKVSDFFLEMDVKEKRILTATFHGNDISQDPDLVFGIITVCWHNWVHPKSHLLAEKSARQISRNGCDELKESSRFVVSLHDSLWHSATSPLGATEVLATGNTRGGAAATLDKPMPHDLRNKSEFPFFQFLLESRRALIATLKNHGLSQLVDEEALFHNVIVHSLDHSGMCRVADARGRYFSYNLTKSISSYVRAFVFVEFFNRPIDNPVVPESIKDLKSQFYQDLYQALVQINPEYANCIRASCSH